MCEFVADSRPGNCEALEQLCQWRALPVLFLGEQPGEVLGDGVVKAKPHGVEDRVRLGMEMGAQRSLQPIVNVLALQVQGLQAGQREDAGGLIQDFSASCFDGLLAGMVQLRCVHQVLLQAAQRQHDAVVEHGKCVGARRGALQQLGAAPVLRYQRACQAGRLPVHDGDVDGPGNGEFNNGHDEKRLVATSQRHCIRDNAAQEEPKRCWTI